ncbi:MAG TPA: hypothetical protein VN457_05960 [Chlamydiales bacterium]|nr:hypothetical protein [Chlamydiales bacterium]
MTTDLRVSAMKIQDLLAEFGLDIQVIEFQMLTRTSDEAAKAIGFEFEIKPLIDGEVLTYNEVWAAAGTPFAVFRIEPQALLKITQATIVDVRK